MVASSLKYVQGAMPSFNFGADLGPRNVPVNQLVAALAVSLGLYRCSAALQLPEQLAISKLMCARCLAWCHAFQAALYFWCLPRAAERIGESIGCSYIIDSLRYNYLGMAATSVFEKKHSS